MDTSGNPSGKVIAIATGEAHTVAVTGDGKVYSWGRGTFGRLGNGSEVDQHFPIRIQFTDNNNNNNIKIVGVSAGAYHTLALADDGSVWSWGYNSYGQLGVEGDDDSFVPCLVKMPINNENEKPLKIFSVKAGGMVSLAIDDLGHLWMWGTLQGTSIDEMESTPSIPISIHFNDYTVVKVACGGGHIVAIVNNGNNLACYSWGNNAHGQLGLGDTEARPNPQIIEAFNTLEPCEVSCGASHTCVLAYSTTTKTESESVCYSFGRGSNGQLGLGTTKDSPCPQRVTALPENLVLVSVDCGLFHTSVVSSSGHVWSWGMENGLGLCPEASFVETDGGDALSPRLINGPDFKQPVQVACGAAHTVVLADSGYKLWSWGRGRSGVLGNGQDVDFFKPKAVLWPPPNETVSETVGKKIMEKDNENATGMDKKLSGVMEELTFVQSKLSVMENYASILHGSIYGRPFEGDRDIPVSLRDPRGTFDITKEWENMLELCDRRKLVRLQMFYRNMLAGVKDKMLKLRVKEMLKEYLESSAGTSH